MNWAPTPIDGGLSTPIAPFGDMGSNAATPQITTFASITCGTSNTLLMSEILMAQSHDDNDWRGDIQNDQGEFCPQSAHRRREHGSVRWVRPVCPQFDLIVHVERGGLDVWRSARQ